MAYTLKSSSISTIMMTREVTTPSQNRTSKKQITTPPLRRKNANERWIASRLSSKRKVERICVSQRSPIMTGASKWNDRYALLYFRIESLRSNNES